MFLFMMHPTSRSQLHASIQSVPAWQLDLDLNPMATVAQRTIGAHLSGQSMATVQAKLMNSRPAVESPGAFAETSSEALMRLSPLGAFSQESMHHERGFVGLERLNRLKPRRNWAM
jgi:hypothetical protein